MIDFFLTLATHWPFALAFALAPTLVFGGCALYARVTNTHMWPLR